MGSGPFLVPRVVELRFVLQLESVAKPKDGVAKTRLLDHAEIEPGPRFRQNELRKGRELLSWRARREPSAS